MRAFAQVRTVSLRLGATALALAVAACSAAGTPAPAGTSGPGATTPPGATNPVAGTNAPTGAPGETKGAGTAAPAGDGCRFATAAEVGTAYGFAATKATPTPPGDDNYVYCQYASADDRTVIQTYVSRSQTALLIYDGYKQQADETVSGLGDEAFWDGGVLYIKKGGVFAGIAPRSGSSGTVDVNDAGVALGRIIAGRM